MFDIGEIVRLKESLSISHIQGMIYMVLDINTNDSYRVIKLLPKEVMSIQYNLPSSRFERLDGITKSDINSGIYKLDLLPNGSYQLVYNSISTKAIPDTITKEKLLEVFKYIPMSHFNGYSGFYNPGNKKLLVSYMKNYKDKKRFNELIDITDDSIIKFYNSDILLQGCKFRIKGYERSAKLFKFTNQKKEAYERNKLAPEYVIASKLELQATVKNSDKLEDTIYIKLGESTYRFVLEDIEIIYPNINGYNPKKDKTIKAGIKVRVINDHQISFAKKNDILVPMMVYTSNKQESGMRNKTYLGFKVDGKIVYGRINKFKIV